MLRMFLRLSVAAVLMGLMASAQADITVTDSRGEQRLDAVPERVVALNWSMAENLVELGVEPVGVADTDGYRKWAGRPQLPESVEDVGGRAEPNMERIASLDPDLIVLSTAQTGLAEKMEKVAPVLFFDAYRRDHDNPEQARAIFRTLARLFERTDRAEKKLDQLDGRFGELRQRLEDHFGDDLPRVTSALFTSPSVVRVFGDNSMPQYALKRLGMEPALPQKRTQWGQVQKKVSDLSGIEDGILLYFKPVDQAGDLFSKPLWKALPVVEKDRVAAVEPSWTYGGAMSLRYLAENMTDALLTIDP